MFVEHHDKVHIRMWNKDSQVRFVQCFYKIHIHVWAMRYKLCDFWWIHRWVKCSMFTFKTKSFIFLYLEGLKKQNTMTSWWEGQGIDCDKKQTNKPLFFSAFNWAFLQLWNERYWVFILHWVPQSCSWFCWRLFSWNCVPHFYQLRLRSITSVL